MKNKSFTLIELLVVIAIIGLLASIVIVNLTGTRSKANIARGLQFSQSVHHALGAYAVGVWSFDEGSGTTAFDASGYGNNGTINGASYITDTPSNTGYALSFDGVDDYVGIGVGTDYFPLPLFSICAWAKTPGLAPGMTTNGIISLTYGLIFRLSGSGLFQTSIDNGVDTIVSLTAPGNLADNQFHHLCLTFDGTKRYMFIDGTEAINVVTTWTGTTRWPTNPCVIGHDVNYTIQRRFNGLIDEVRIYREALAVGQIQQLYAAGAEKRGLAIK